MRIFIAATVVMMLFLSLGCLLPNSNGSCANAASEEKVIKTRYHVVPGVVKFRAGLDWYLVSKKNYGKRRPVPDVLLFNRVNSKASIQINLKKTHLSPTSLIKFIKWVADPDIRWHWIKKGGENPARVYFEDDKIKKVGFIDVRHLPGRYSHLLVVVSSWLKKDHKKMVLEYDQVVGSIVSDS